MSEFKTIHIIQIRASLISVVLVICNSCTLSTSFKSYILQYFKCFPNKRSVNLSRFSPFFKDDPYPSDMFLDDNTTCIVFKIMFI